MCQTIGCISESKSIVREVHSISKTAVIRMRIKFSSISFALCQQDQSPLISRSLVDAACSALTFFARFPQTKASASQWSLGLHFSCCSEPERRFVLCFCLHPVFHISLVHLYFGLSWFSLQRSRNCLYFRKMRR